MSSQPLNLNLLLHYFPNLNADQRERLAALEPLYREWNGRINVISRKDIDNLYEHHVLHSLAIARVATFAPAAEVLDLGTGGGFPGIPLAILFPETRFHLVDSIGKKLKVVEAVAAALGLTNVTTEHLRAEQLTRRFDSVVSRAVATVPTLLAWLKGKLDNDADIFLLKGGFVADELAACHARTTIYSISDFFVEPFFIEKKVLKIKMP